MLSECGKVKSVTRRPPGSELSLLPVLFFFFFFFSLSPRTPPHYYHPRTSRSIAFNYS